MCLVSTKYQNDILYIVDVDECSANQSLCEKPHEKCVNLPGSFKCDCQAGFVATSDGCQVQTKGT